MSTTITFLPVEFETPQFFRFDRHFELLVNGCAGAAFVVSLSVRDLQALVCCHHF